MLTAYATVIVFLLVAVGFVAGSMALGRLLRPNHMTKAKEETYECGEAPIGQAWFNFNPRFYIIALIFIVFDVEIAFIYPVATVYRRWVDAGWGWFALGEIGVFVGILMLGLVYVWKKGDLEFIRAIKRQPQSPQTETAVLRPEPTPAVIAQPAPVGGE